MDLAEIEEALRGMLSGDLDLVEGCRALVRHRGELEPIAASEYEVIAAVESETDDLLLGGQSLSSSNALKRSDLEKEAYLRSVREILLAACRGILTKLPSNPNAHK